MKKIFCIIVALSLLLTVMMPVSASYGEESNLLNLFFERNIEPLRFSPAFSSFTTFSSLGSGTGYRLRESSWKDDTLDEIVASVGSGMISKDELSDYYDAFYEFFDGKEEDFELFESFVLNDKLQILPLPKQNEAMERFPSISDYISQNFYGATYFFNAIAALRNCYYDDMWESPVHYDDDHLYLNPDVIDYIDFLENTQNYSAMHLVDVVNDAFDFINSADSGDKDEFVSYLYDNEILDEYHPDNSDNNQNGSSTVVVIKPNNNSSDSDIQSQDSTSNDNSSNETDTNNNSEASSGSSSSGSNSDSYYPDTAVITTGQNTTDSQSTDNAGENDGEPANPDVGEQEIEFSDVSSSHWAYSYIKLLVKNGVVSGIGDSLFAPENNIKREEFAKIIVEAFGFDKTTQNSIFTDVDNSAWYEPYVMAAYANGIIKGKSETQFGSGENITRQDMCVMIARAAEKKGILSGQISDVDFSDIEDIASYAKDAVLILSNMHIISGFEDNSFRPMANATRAQASKIIAELIYAEK